MKKANRQIVPEIQLQRAHAMRLAPTPQERKLWFALRQRLQPKSHFRRQVAIGPYIVDFCCLASRLVIEVDGNQHGTDQAQRYDTKRTALIEAQGYRVLRFSNHDVNTALDSVLDTIAAVIPRSTTPGLSPNGSGEEILNHG